LNCGKQLFADDRLELTDGLCEAAISCFDIRVRGDALSRGHTHWRDLQQADVVCLVAMGLFNTLIDTKAEDNLPRRDPLLDELRALAQAHRIDALMRKCLEVLGKI
jgi:hypothetical protein